MPKKGTAFEKVVADIFQSFDDVTDVVQGKWTPGPDGRRDRDVSFTGLVNGSRYRGLIECKDYNPQSTGKVGIGVVDALESKSRDLNITFPIICSNAGFARPAMDKARRVGIAIIAALRMGDERIRFEVRDIIYFRKITVPVHSLRMQATPPPNLPLPLPEGYSKIHEATFEGRSLLSWFISRILLPLGAYPIVNGTFRYHDRFLTTVTFETPQGDIDVIELNMEFSLSGAWYRHDVTIDATNGIYDWVRKRMRSASRHGQLQIRDFDVYAGTPVKIPPDYVLTRAPFAPGEIEMTFGLLHMAQPTGPPALLDQYLSPADKVVVIDGIDASAYTSVPGYVHPK